MESRKTKKKRIKAVKENSKGVDNDSFELNETDIPNDKKDKKSTDLKSTPKPRMRTKKTKDSTSRTTLAESVGSQIHDADHLVGVTETPPLDRFHFTGITIHRADQLRVDPHISHLLVRLHVMDEQLGSYHHSRHGDQGDSVVRPICTKAVRAGSGQFLLPIWEQMLVVEEDYANIIQNRSSLLLFEILNASCPNPSKGQELELVAWAFLRPLGANGRLNAGPRKQRLQLFEPVSSGRIQSACCLSNSSRGNQRTTSSSNELGPQNDSALRAGTELLACWAAGSSHRIKYPSTIYVSLKMLDLNKTYQKEALTLRSLPIDVNDELTEDGETSILSSAQYKRKTMLDSSFIPSAWKREGDQPCRVPNELIGCGTRWHEDPGLRTLTWPTSLSSSTAIPNAISRGAQCVRFSPNGQWLAVGSLGPVQGARAVEAGDTDQSGVDCAVWLYRYPIRSVTSAPRIQLVGHTRTVYAIEWAPTSLTSDPKVSTKLSTNQTKQNVITWPLASASGDGTVRVWWIAPSLLNASCDKQQSNPHAIVSLLESPPQTDQLGGVNGEHYAAMTNNKGVLCTVLGHPGFVYSLAFCPVAGQASHTLISNDPLGELFVPQTKHLLATGCYDQSVRLWAIRPRRAELLIELSNGHRAHINSITFSRDGQRLYSADAKGMLTVWKSLSQVSGETRLRQSAINTIGRNQWALEKRLTNEELDDCVINHVEAHPTQPLLLVHTRDGIPKMIDLRSGFVAVRFHGSLNYHELIRSCISPCGTFVFSGSEDRKLYVWNALTGDQVACYSHLRLRSTITAISYHPTDNVFAFTVQDGSEAPLRVYAYDPKATTLQTTIPQIQEISERCTKRFDVDKERLEHIRSTNQRRKRERIKKAFAKLDSVLNTDLRPSEMCEYADELEWRPTFTSIDEPKRGRSAVRGRPDGEAKSSDASNQNQNDRTRIEQRDQLTTAIAIYDYRAERSDELTLRRGDQVQLLYRDTPKWWMARATSTGKEGFVPANYITYDENGTSSKALSKQATPAQRTKLSVQHVAQLLNNLPTDKTDQRTPTITVEDVENNPEPIEQEREQERRRSSLRSSPNNLITLTPIRSPQKINEATMERRSSRPLPEGGNVEVVKESQNWQELVKSPTVSPRSLRLTDGFETHSNKASGASLNTKIDTGFKQMKELSTNDQCRRPSRPLPPLD